MRSLETQLLPCPQPANSVPAGKGKVGDRGLTLHSAQPGVQNNSGAGEILPGGGGLRPKVPLLGFRPSGAAQSLPPLALGAFSEPAKAFTDSGSIIRVSVARGAAVFVWCYAPSSLIYPELSWGRGCLLMERSVIVRCQFTLYPLEFLRRSKPRSSWNLVTPTVKRSLWKQQKNTYLAYAFLKRFSQKLFAKGF